MKRTTPSPILFVLLATLILALSACVRPVPTPAASPVPTAIPGLVPSPIPPTIPAIVDPDLPTGYPGVATAVPGDDGLVAPTPESPTAVPPTGPTSHTIQPGDTLYSIAQKYGTTVEAITATNGIANPNNVPVGTVLVIPAPGQTVPPQPPSTGTETVHIVQAGENLFRIGLRYGFTAAELAAYNGIPDPTRIYVGQIIRIPAN